MTVLRLITRALRKAGALGTSEDPDTDDYQDLLDTANDFLESKSEEGFQVFCNQRSSITFTNGDAQITLGPTGDQVFTPRPVEIEHASYLVDDTEIPLRILQNQSEWAAELNKALTGTYPQWIYLERTMPNSTLHVGPVPNQNVSGYLYLPQALVSFTSLTQEISLPRAYSRMLVHGLAIEYAPEHDLRIREDIRQIFNEAQAIVKVRNERRYTLMNETALLNSNYGGGRGGYDIFSDR